MIQWRYGLLLVLLLPALSWGQVAVETVLTCSTGAAASTGCTIALPVATATDRAVVCSVCIRDATTAVSSVTYGAQALALAERVVAASSETLSGELWTLLAPTSGTQTVTLTLTAADTAAMTCAALNGVHQSVSFGTVTSVAPTGFSFTTAQATTTVEDDLVLDSVCYRNTTTAIVPGASQTKRSEVFTTQGSVNLGNFTSTALATTTSTTLSWSWTNAERRTHQLLPVHPSAGGGGVPPPPATAAYADGALSSPCVGTYDVTARDCGADPGTANGYPTIGGCIAAMNAGETCYVRPGTYFEHVNNTLPSGLSAANPTTLTTLPGEERLAKIECDAAGSVSEGTSLITLAGTSKQYIHIANLELDGNGTVINSGQGCAMGVIIQEPRFITLEGMDIHHARYNGILVSSSSGARSDANGTDVHMRNMTLHDNGLASTTSMPHAVYFAGARGSCTHCTMYGNARYGLHIYDSGGVQGNDDHVCQYCYIRDNTIRADSCTAAMGSGHRNILANSVVVDNYCGAIFIGSGNTIYGSLFYGHEGAGVQGNNSGTVINVISANNTPAFLNNGGTITQVNSIGGTPAFRDAANRDFNLLSTDTAALQQGADRRGTTCPANNAGIPINCNFATAGGVRPNIGPFNELQRPLSSVLVGRTMTDATSLLLTVSMPVTGRVTACMPALFTVLGSTTAPAGTTPTACVIGGNGTSLDLTVTPTFVTGETITVTAAYGAFEGVRIGSDQDYLPERSWEGTALSVVNAIGAAPSTAVLTQTACAWYEPSGTEAGALPLTGGAATAALPVSGGAVLRCKLAGTVADPAAFAPRLFCRNNADAYAAASTTCTSTGLCINLGLAPQLAHGQATTERLASQHATTVAGTVSDTGTFALWDPVQDSEGEFVTAVQVGSAASGTFDCRLEQADGTDLDGYATLNNGLAAPRLTVTGGGIAGTTIRLYGLQGQ